GRHGFLGYLSEMTVRFPDASEYRTLVSDLWIEGTGRFERGFQALEISAPRNFRRAERPEMGGCRLSIEEQVTSRVESFDDMMERDLRPIALAREHRLAGEQPPDRHAVKTADDLAFMPDLDRVRMAGFVERDIGLFELARDPGAHAAFLGFRAA